MDVVRKLIQTQGCEIESADDLWILFSFDGKRYELWKHSQRDIYMFRYDVTDVFNIHIDWYLVFDDAHLNLNTDAEGRMRLRRLVGQMETFAEAFNAFVEGVKKFLVSLTQLDGRQSAMIGERKVKEKAQAQKKTTAQLTLV